MKFKEYINEVKIIEPLFTVDNAKSVAKQIEKNIKAPVVKAEISTLGGDENISILILISLDEKKDWINGILENSRYIRLHLTSKDHILEHFSGSFGIKGLRKSRPKTIDVVIKKINTYIKSV